MANRKLLRQYITDYQRDIEKSVADAKAGYTQYNTDTAAFNDMVQAQYAAQGGGGVSNHGVPIKTAVPYYDRDSASNKYAGDDRVGATFAPAQSFNFSGDGLTHNAAAQVVGIEVPREPVPEVDGGYVGDSGNPAPPAPIQYSRFDIIKDGNVIGTTATHPGGSNLYWDAYDKIWRNAPSAGAVPVQREVKDPNLTNKEIGILQGKGPSYAEQVMNAQSKSSAFNDPKDPSNLKDAGILTRVIAGQL